MLILRKLVPVLGLVLVSLALAQLAERQEEDKTLSPYFFVQSDDPSVDRLPLLKTEATVDIAGVIADVKVTQVYKNDGKRPIEAVYTFPASTRAAVYAMKMTIGDRTIVARIKERDEARLDYEAARQQGKSASLLEQQRPNVFQMNVANIMPGDYIKVEMSYTELLVPVSGVYEFVYPTVVGPRYNRKAGSESHKPEQWVKSPYTREGDAPSYEFGMTVNIVAGMPLQDVSCPTHKTMTAFNGSNEASVRLDPSEKAGGNRDFILRYRLAGSRIQTGLLLYPDKDEQFFLLMLQPPKRVEVSQIPAREYIFILDVSGSMHGFPLDISRKLMRNLLSNLRPKDCFNILFFSGGNFVLSEKSLPATEKNVADALATIEKQQGSGGTELLPALRRALALPRNEGTSRTVVIATDGYVTVETEAFDLIRDNLNKANLFAFGIGSSVNRYIIEGMAHVGMGEPFIVEKPEQAEAQAEKFRAYIESPVLTGIDIDFPEFDAYDVEPKTVPDVTADRPIIVFGKYRGKASGAITVRGWAGKGRYSEAVKVADFAPDKRNSALRYLWARHRIQLLADYNNLDEDKERAKEVTRLGLKYNLLTRYTSFVAIDQQVRNVGGRPEVVEQPLPMPEGVSDYAVSGRGVAGYSGLYKGGRHFAGSTSAPTSGGALMPEPEATSQSPVLRGTVRIVKLEVTGGRSEQSVKGVIEKKLANIRAAYVSELASNPTLAGRLVLEFTIEPDGTVREARAVRNELNAGLERKALELVKGLSFEKFQGRTATVALTLDLRPWS